jgi:MYXO-CTERM domain-containing protein
VETQVEVLPNATEVAVTKVADGRYDILVVPLDQAKNYLGPGFESQVQLKLPKGSGQVASVSDALVDGSYTIHVTNVPPGADPQAEVLVAGFSVATGPLSQLGQIPSGGGGSGGSGGSGGASGGGGGATNGGTGGDGPYPPVSCRCLIGQQGMGPTLPVLFVLLGVAGFGLRRRR